MANYALDVESLRIARAMSKLGIAKEELIQK